MLVFDVHSEEYHAYVCITVEPLITWTILMMSLLPFWALNVAVTLLSMQGQKALGFHKKILSGVSKMNEGLTGLERHEGQ